MNKQTPLIVGHLLGTNEPIYALPEMPGAGASLPNLACHHARLPPTLQDLLDDVCDITEDMELVVTNLGAQLQGMPSGVAIGEDALRASLVRESLVRQLAVASQGVIQLKALIGTANQFLS